MKEQFTLDKVIANPGATKKASAVLPEDIVTSN